MRRGLEEEQAPKTATLQEQVARTGQASSLARATNLSAASANWVVH